MEPSVVLATRLDPAVELTWGQAGPPRPGGRRSGGTAPFQPRLRSSSVMHAETRSLRGEGPGRAAALVRRHSQAGSAAHGEFPGGVPAAPSA